MTFIYLLASIALILIAGKIFGEIASRFRVSPFVGEMLAGILFGPLLGIIIPSSDLQQIAGFGAIFLFFLIGLSMRFDDFKGNVYPSSIIALVGVLLSFVFGFGIGIFAGVGQASLIAPIILGLALISTSIPISLQSMMDIGELQSKASKMMRSVYIADSAVALMAIAVLSSWFALGGVRIWDIVAIFFAVLGLFVIITSFGSKLVGRAMQIFRTLHDENILFSLSLVIAFLVAAGSEYIGLAGIAGAFLAGMAMSRTDLTQSVIVPKVKIIGHGFFIPLFFAYSALLMDINALFNLQTITIIVLLVIFGIGAKYVACNYMSRHFGFRPNERRMLGFGMIPRGEYSIIIAQIALAAGAITSLLYSSILFFVLIVAILMPLIMKIK